VGEQEGAAPVIVIKKKKGHGGHHGGAWKVAYADFVTAMMAFFMVMWLMNSSQKVQEAVGAYFRDPTGAGRHLGSNLAGSGDALSVDKNNLDKLKENLEQAMKKMPEFDKLKDQVSMTVTGEGLRVELLETEQGLFFASGNAQPSEMGEELLVLLAKQFGALPNNVLIEGHTDARPFHSDLHYGNWELSADRANASRKLMEEAGLRQGQVTQVRGFADRRLRLPDKPDEASNRRVSVIVQYLDGYEAPTKAVVAPAATHGEAKPAAKGH
jgi:chemotaxis protein MotB